MGKKRLSSILVGSALIAILSLASCGKYSASTANGGGNTTTTGALDTTWGTSGVSTIPFSGTLSKIAALSNNSVVASGINVISSQPNVYLVHFTSEGALDTTSGGFGNGTGEVQTTLTDTKEMLVQAVSGGQAILVAGAQTAIDGTSGLSSTITLIDRYTPLGVADTSFNSTGSVSVDTAFPSGTFDLEAMTLQPTSGRILVAGGYQSSMNPKSAQLGIAGFTANGTLDTTFGSNGIAITNINGSGTPNAVSVSGITSDSSQNIYVSVTSCPGGDGYNPQCPLYLFRFTQNGALDTTFGTWNTGSSLAYGYIAVPTGKGVMMALTSSGLPLLSLTYGGVSTIARFLAGTSSASSSAGAIDTSFGGAVGQFASPGTHFTQNSDGTILIAGKSQTQNMSVSRYTAAGALDTTFNVSGSSPGTLEIAFSTQYGSGVSVATDSNKKILLGGTILTVGSSGPSPAIAIARVAP